jgi:RNA polymerase sigma factor (sigma-70 family)
MREGYELLEVLAQRLLPANTTDRNERYLAWNDWIMAGGTEPVMRFIRYKNGTGQDDDEILQETLIVGFQKVEAGQYEDRNLPFSAFLKKIAWYKILEASRNISRECSLESVIEVAADDARADEAHADLWIEAEAMSLALKALPRRRAMVVTLYEQGYSTTEIAGLLDIREDLVRKEKSLALRQLRQHVPLALAS